VMSAAPTFQLRTLTVIQGYVHGFSAHAEKPTISSLIKSSKY
jgi:hypothetical protein